MRVRVSAPSRLHLGDIDPFGLGRFGFAPMVAIDRPRTLVEASTGPILEVLGLERDEAKNYAEKMLAALDLTGVKINVLSTAPRHYGFGSTTQLSLAIGKAITLAYNRTFNSVELAQILKRTSTGGVHSFQHGGFIVAGGLKIQCGMPILNRVQPALPPLIFHSPFPDTWRFVIVQPSQAPPSPDGSVEEQVYQQLHTSPIPVKLIHEAYFLLMSELVPAVIEEDAMAFGDALTKIQIQVGRIYQPVQGSVFNKAAAWVIPILRRYSPLGIGQSSWGPTIYAFLESDKKAIQFANDVTDEIAGRAEVSLAKPDNQGVTASTIT